MTIAQPIGDPHICPPICPCGSGGLLAQKQRDIVRLRDLLVAAAEFVPPYTEAGRRVFEELGSDYAYAGSVNIVLAYNRGQEE